MGGGTGGMGAARLLQASSVFPSTHPQLSRSSADSNGCNVLTVLLGAAASAVHGGSSRLPTYRSFLLGLHTAQVQFSGNRSDFARKTVTRT